MSELAIVRAGLERVDDLAPLWLALRDHHHEVAPHLGPVREDEESWAMRRRSYVQWLAEPDAFVLIAELAGAAVGYALVTVNEGSPTWRDLPRFGLLETLSVLPDARGRRIGRALVEAVWDELERIGVRELRLDVMATNRPALAFYERLGFAPDSLQLSARRPGS